MAAGEYHASFGAVVVKTTIVHTATYFIMGLFALYAFNYEDSFSTGDLALFMRPVSDPIVMAGPLFQPIRGVLFGLVLYLLRDVLFARERGWLIIWVMLAVLSILNPFGPAPGSIEGAIYTRLSFPTLFSIGTVEVYAQSLFLSLGVFFWVRNPHNRWLGWGFSIVAGLAILLPLAGLFLAPMAQQAG